MRTSERSSSGRLLLAAAAAAAAVVVMVTTSLVLVRASSSSGQPQVPGFFIFGDSLVDNGNNNRILTLSRANYMPYGVDFPEGSSGRFTNGRTVVDVLAQLLGFREYIPPYATTRGLAIVRGMNFASGAAGIRDETGNNLGDHFPMGDQIDHFRKTVDSIFRIFRGNRTRLCEYLSKSIFYVGLGSNDYLNNYFMPNIYSSSRQYTTKTYASLLLHDYQQHINQLYEMGARKVVVAGVGQIGCIPYELARYNDDDGDGIHCNETINKAITQFNSGLLKVVKSSNSDFGDANFIYLNAYDSLKDVVKNAAAYGFEVVNKGCCGVGRNNGEITCLPSQQPCEDRSKYLFWDAFHPTEAANIIFARKAYASTSTDDVYPMNIRQLVDAMA